MVYQDDPKVGQHTQYCYDGMSRLVRKLFMASDAFCPGACAGSCASQVSSSETYAYVESDGPGYGRLESVTSSSGDRSTYQYDYRGQTVQQGVRIIANGTQSNAQVLTQYDEAGHVHTMLYPNGEFVVFGYNAVGQVSSVSGDQTYLANLTYDRFGRARRVSHGNGALDELGYQSQASEGFRLKMIRTMRGEQTYLDYDYAAYQANGMISDIVDHAYPAGSVLNGSRRSMSYDGLGRLRSVQRPNGPSWSYEYL